MNILVIGSGGREHALVWKIRQSPLVDHIICAPGNAGIAAQATCVPLAVNDFPALAACAKEQHCGLTVVGPEVPLAAGIVDYFREQGLPIFGPDRNAARLEGSKAFAKTIMQKYGVCTAAYRAFSDAAAARVYLSSLPAVTRLVVKADGLAAGKGVIICQDTAAALQAVDRMLEGKAFGAAGSEIVIEEFLEGEEVSIQLFLSGKNYRFMVAAQDHKRALDNDQGLNTGGMGAYAPAPVFDAALRTAVERDIVQPLVAGLVAEGIEYRGVLYIGLMIVAGKPYVLEFNCRFGDPETQVVLPLLKTDLVDIMRQVSAGTLDKTVIEWYTNSAVCVVLAADGYPGEYRTGVAIQGFDQAAQHTDAVVFHAGTATRNGMTVTSGGRVLGITGIGADVRRAVQAAYRAVEAIQFDGMHYRTDIAKRALIR